MTCRMAKRVNSMADSDPRWKNLTSKRRQALSLTRSGSQQRPKYDSNFNPRREPRPTKNSKGSSLKALERLSCEITKLWGSCTVLASAGISRLIQSSSFVRPRVYDFLGKAREGSPERNDLISKNLQKAFGKAQNSRWNRNDRWRWSPCLANTGFRTELSPSAEQVSTQ